MTNQATASSPVVSLQDPGTGTASSKDPISAAMIGGALPHVSNVILSGLNLSANTDNSTLSVSAGSALIEHPGNVTVQSSAGGNYDLPWNGPSVLPVSIGQTTGIAEDQPGTNHVYLDVDTSTDNSVSIVVSGSENPTELGDASIYLGVADTFGGDTDDSAGDRRLSEWEVGSLIAGDATLGSVDADIYSTNERFYVIQNDSQWDDMKSERSALTNPPPATVILTPDNPLSITSIDFRGTLIMPHGGYTLSNDLTISGSGITIIGLNVTTDPGGPYTVDVQGVGVKLVNCSAPVLDVNGDGCEIYGAPGTINVAAEGCRIIGGDENAIDVDVADGVGTGSITGVSDVNLTGNGASNFTVGVLDKANSANSDLAYKSDL